MNRDANFSIGDRSTRAGTHTLNTSHRADIEAIRTCGVFRQDHLDLVKTVVRNNIGAFIWPDISEEDLLEGHNILTLLESRSQYPPASFIHFDGDVLRLLDSTCVRSFRCIRKNGGEVGRIMHPTDCNPPITDSETGKEILFGACANWMGTSMDVYERQIPILEFLVSFRDLVLEEASSINSLQKASPGDQTENICTKEWQWSLRYLYLPPKVDSLLSCAELIQTRLDEARDQLFGLRECPRTFQTYTKRFECSDPEYVKDKQGKTWAGPIGLSTRVNFRNKSVTEAIAAIFQDARMWDIVAQRINDVGQYNKHTEDSRQAMYKLKGFLQDRVLPRLLHQLRFYLLTSPGMKDFVYRRTTRNEKRKLNHRVEFRKNALQNLLDDRFMWTLFQLVTKGVGLSGLDSVTLIIELRRLVEKRQVRVVQVSSVVDRIIADLALVAELWIHCNRFAPYLFYHVSESDYWKQSCATRADIVQESAIYEEFNALSDPDNNEKFLGIGHTVHHTLSTLEYPIDQPRTKARIETMQQSESNLDDFWNKFDKHVKKHCSAELFKDWETTWPLKKDLKRTPNWTNPTVAPISSGLDAVNLSFGQETAPASDVTQASKKDKKKKKKKKTKEQAPTDENTGPQTTDHTELSATEAAKPIIKVNKQAYQIFEGGIFFVPGNRDKPNDIQWQDFLKAMQSLGFKAGNLFGSIWRFEPAEKAKSAGLLRSINFHQPHGKETKIDHWMAREIGRRLTRTYKIDMSSLDIEK